MFSFAMFPMPSRPFCTQYRCFSVSMLPGNERQDVEQGGKLILPPSALDQLTRLNIAYPMLFKLTNSSVGRHTHAGVLEFVADEGKAYLPHWMMQNLLLSEGDLISIESVSLPVATFSRFQPLSRDFLDISDPKAVLERCLRRFACLTEGDVLALSYNDRAYELRVLSTKPERAVAIIECDMHVEFSPPLGYEEANKISDHTQSEEETDFEIPVEWSSESSKTFQAFSGRGCRLDGKERGTEFVSKNTGIPQRGIPDFSYVPGSLKFIHAKKSTPSPKIIENGEFSPFQGVGQTLRQSNKGKNLIN